MKAKKPEPKKAPSSGVKAIAQKRLGENGIIYEVGEEFTTTAKRKKALGDLVK
jgi:hypothetical protein|tara:strand:+ start:3971 stop:4129 length:159 start_codon:yes stop_codon:yes gene_type:complete